MHRSAAFVAFLALSWSQLVALHCDMGAGPSTIGAHASTPASHAPAGHEATGTDAHNPPPHHLATAPTPAADTPPTPHHAPSHGCLMIMACGFASVRQARPAAMIRLPAVFFTADFLTSPIPVAADLAVETPPPRHTV